MFRVGQKVVCIRVRGADGNQFGLRVGGVYTVSDFGICFDPERVLIDLVEIKTPVPHAFAPEDFRPAVERKTDIGFAHEILRKATKPTPARAAFQDAERTAE